MLKKESKTSNSFVNSNSSINFLPKVPIIKYVIVGVHLFILENDGRLSDGNTAVILYYLLLE